LSNLRQLGQVAHLYANENKGWFPVRSSQAGVMWPPEAVSHISLQPYSIGDMRPLWYKYFPGSDIDRPLKVFYCPAMDGTDILLGFGNQNWPGNRARIGPTDITSRAIRISGGICRTNR
jgi:hypothetical protein